MKMRFFTQNTQFLFIGLCILSALVLLATAMNSLSIGTWKATHWLFTYDEGFIKRGLIGSIYQWLGGAPSLKMISAAAWFVAVSVTALFAWTIGRMIFRAITEVRGKKEIDNIRLSSPEVITGLIFALWLISSPGTVVQMSHDVGRFDVFGLLILVIIFWVIMGTSRNVSLSLMISLIVLAIAAHEAFFFWLPWVSICMWVLRNDLHSGDFFRVAAVAVISVVFTFYVGSSDYSRFVEYESLKQGFSLKADFEISSPSLMVHYREVADNILYSFERSWGPRRFAGFLASSMILFPYLYILSKLMQIYKKERAASAFLVATIWLFLAAPIFLFLLGHDQGRWISMFNVSIIFAFLVLLRRFPSLMIDSSLYLKSGVAYATFLQVAIGAFGVTAALPGLDRFFKLALFFN